MRGVPFLPQELRGAQKEACPHLPPDDVGPLIDQQRQVPIRLNPVPVGVPDDRLRSGPDHQSFFQFRPARMRDRRDFRREAFNVFGFLPQEAFGNHQRKVRVLVAGGLEHVVQRPLHLLPDGISVWDE